MAAYGVLWPGIGATLTRLGSNVGLTLGTDYNSLQPWGGMRRINLTDNGIITAIQNLAGTGCGYDDSQTGVAAKGQAMTMIPAFLIYVDTTGYVATSTVAAPVSLVAPKLRPAVPLATLAPRVTYSV